MSELILMRDLSFRFEGSETRGTPVVLSLGIPCELVGLGLTVTADDRAQASLGWGVQRMTESVFDRLNLSLEIETASGVVTTGVFDFEPIEDDDGTGTAAQLRADWVHGRVGFANRRSLLLFPHDAVTLVPVLGNPDAGASGFRFEFDLMGYSAA